MATPWCLLLSPSQPLIIGVAEGSTFDSLLTYTNFNSADDLI